jgi:DNA processing protein
MEKRTLTDAERRDWLRLFRSENVGPATFLTLIEHFDDAGRAIEAAPELSRRGGRKRAIRIAPVREIEEEIAALSELGGRMIALCEPDYPEALAAIHDPPPVLSVLGDSALLSHPSVAVVGARNASAAGRRLAREISAGISRNGFTVISGLARGIDTAAHEGALEARPSAATIAVIAGGADIVYPKENQALYERIVNEGAVITEQRLGTQPTARHFPPRNRLVSGLSLGTLIVEAAPRSGSLITARMALEQGREVFAIPGSPLDPRYKGTNGLIRDGAILTETADDVTGHLMAAVPPRFEEPNEPVRIVQAIDSVSENSPDSTRIQIENLLGPVTVSVDELRRECQLSPAVVLTVLLEMELAGRLERHPGNRVSLVL